MKKIITLGLAAIMATSMLAGCGASNSSSSSQAGFDTNKSITVISREEGSGTRDAFVELTGVLEKDSNGNKTDNTTVEALVIDGTQAVMSNVAGNQGAIGYISLGSLNETVKVVKVDGVAPSAETVKDGTYKISRPFNIATKETVSKVAQDFIDYILSSDGQKIVEDNGYIAVDTKGAYAGSKPEGKIVISGSSSVSPVMEKLVEAYKKVNTNAKIELQTTDSSSGMTATMEGTCDIGMASRELKDKESSLKATKIALDGIAVVINTANTTENITLDNIKGIFTGSLTKWSEVNK